MAAGACAILFAFSAPLYAGDAVAVGYNADGVWTAVTYYCSGTPKGGADFKDEAGAREAARRDLNSRAGEGIATTKIIAASDRTGHFAYARGKKIVNMTMWSELSKGGDDVHAVGFGRSKAEAERNAFAELRRNGATRSQKVIYNYFSHGSEPRSRGGD